MSVSETKPSYSPRMFITTITIGSASYHVHASLTDNNGKNLSLPPSFDPPTMLKINSLTTQLLLAHEKQRTSQRKSPYDVQLVNSLGIQEKSKKIISHDFLVHPLDSQLAQESAAIISSHSLEQNPATLKAQDIWNTIDDIFKTSYHPPTPASLSSTPSPSPSRRHSVSTSPRITLPPSPSVLSSEPTFQSPEVEKGPAIEKIDGPISQPDPLSKAVLADKKEPSFSRRLVLSTELDLKGFDFTQADWYEKIPLRLRLRICLNIIHAYSTQPIENRVWKYFEKIPRASFYSFLRKEIKKLSEACEILPSPLPITVRREGEKILKHYYSSKQDKKLIEPLSQKFPIDDLFIRYYKELDEAASDRAQEVEQEWIRLHYLENQNLFIRTLERYLDNQ